MRIIGIDPGLSGAVALLDPFTWGLEVYDMPTFPNSKGREITNDVILASLFEHSDRDTYLAVYEDVWAMPKQGVSSAFRFGDNFGTIKGALAAHKIPKKAVPATTWKKFFGLTSNKDASRGLATQEFPKNAEQFKLKKHDGRAEAALLAVYGAKVVYPQQIQAAVPR